MGIRRGALLFPHPMDIYTVEFRSDPPQLGVRLLDYESSRHTAQVWRQPSRWLCLRDCRDTRAARDIMYLQSEHPRKDLPAHRHYARSPTRRDRHGPSIRLCVTMPGTVGQVWVPQPTPEDLQALVGPRGEDAETSSGGGNKTAQKAKKTFTQEGTVP